MITVNTTSQGTSSPGQWTQLELLEVSTTTHLILLLVTINSSHEMINAKGFQHIFPHVRC